MAQIRSSLFSKTLQVVYPRMQLLRFHLVEDESCEKEIKQGLEKKLDKMVMRDLYGKFKTAPTEEERERARKEYLDRRGVPESFRW